MNTTRCFHYDLLTKCQIRNSNKQLYMEIVLIACLNTIEEISKLSLERECVCARRWIPACMLVCSSILLIYLFVCCTSGTVVKDRETFWTKITSNITKATATTASATNVASNVANNVPPRNDPSLLGSGGGVGKGQPTAQE